MQSVFHSTSQPIYTIQPSQTKKTRKKCLKLENQEVAKIFSSKIESKILSKFPNLLNTNCYLVLTQEEMDNLYKNISNVYIESMNESLIEQEMMNFEVTNNKTTRNSESKEIKSIKKSLRKTYGQMKKR